MKYWNATWNPITGCTSASEGCANCWAKELHERFHGKGSFDKVTLHEDRLTQPLHWRKPRVVFTDMCDPFHEAVPDAFLDRMMAVIALSPQHQFLLLTKRSKRMLEYMTRREVLPGSFSRKFGAEYKTPCDKVYSLIRDHYGYKDRELLWPLPNLWLGITAETQQTADERIPDLLTTPAAHRWISVEPMLGPIDLHAVPRPDNAYFQWRGETGCIGPKSEPDDYVYACKQGISWVIVGGESGSKARPCNVDWIRGVVGQCKDAGAPVLVKQMGSGPVIHPNQWCEWFDSADWPGQTVATEMEIRLRSRSGADPSAWPADLRVQQYPEGLQL